MSVYTLPNGYTVYDYPDRAFVYGSRMHFVKSYRFNGENFDQRKKAIMDDLKIE